MKKKCAETIISLQHINKSFPLELGGEQQVLFDINFDVCGHLGRASQHV